VNPRHAEETIREHVTVTRVLTVIAQFAVR